jgi:nucleoside-diphosphate-sugar epimerase
MILLVTGGAGFLGSAIVSEFLSEADENFVTEIRVLDIQKPATTIRKSISFIHGDVRDKNLVKKACADVDVVIHAAAIIDWGTRTKKEVLEINVGGTKNVIDACKENKVSCMLYTSSLDAVFAGKSLRNIDETVPYPQKPVNAYCESKQQAELLVKKANGKDLKTCILRPADIYGENDPYHIGSLINMAKGGLYVRLGNGNSICQHVYVRNMAYAHVLATKVLMKNSAMVAGKVYFITDGKGENFFKFFDQIVAGAGYTIWPKNLWLPQWLAYSLGSLTEFIAWLYSPIKKVNPKFSRFAVVYTCSDFTFTADRAKKDFNYSPKYPIDEALKLTIDHYKKDRASH